MFNLDVIITFIPIIFGLGLGAVDYLVKTDIPIMDLVAKVKNYAG